MIDNYGWHYRPGEIEAYCRARNDAGDPVSFGAARPELKGFWQQCVSRGITGIFLQDAERELFGENRPADFQQRGTCVSRGTYRACQDSWLYSLARKGTIGRPVLIAYEPIYAGSRVNVGRGQLGGEDGSVGAWAAQYVHDYGLLERAVYGSVDLSESREDLAVAWGAPGRGVPGELLQASSPFRAISHKAENVEELADCIAAGYAVAFCSNTLWGDRDGSGMARPSGRGGHCEEVCGVFLTADGDLGFVRQQSWGVRPRGPDVLSCKGGAMKTLRQGAYGAYAADLQRALQQGEAWAFEIRTGWRPGSVGELHRCAA